MIEISDTAKKAEADRQGLMLVLSSPSGAGKGTISNLLLKEDDQITLSISSTTRERRSSEVDGVHYDFLSETDFKRLVETDAMLEWAEVHGNYYGTPRDKCEEVLGDGRDLLLDIDYQGAMQVFEKARHHVVSIFILPPSMEELHSRLVRRAEDSSEAIEKRLANAKVELGAWEQYDYIIINDDLNKAYSQVKAILSAERLRRERRPSMFEFIDALKSSQL